MKAFSLMEVFIVIAIVAILSAIVYPHYQHYLIRARRKQAQITLINLATQLEEFHTLQRTYAASIAEILNSNVTKNNYYEFKIDEAYQNSFVISATPIGSQKKDDSCGRLSLNAQGKKSVAGTEGTEKCWEN